MSTTKKDWTMPRPGALVLWQNAPGGGSCFAVVTQVGRNAINVMLFPPDSRLGIPKDSVRHVDDPWNLVHGVNADAGVWDHTDADKEFAALKRTVADMVIRDLKAAAIK